VYSCNVPVPTEVSRLARGLASECLDATPRDRHALVLKRLGDGAAPELGERVRTVLAGTAPFEVRVTGVDVFSEPPIGRGPVAHLAIESPRLVELHHELCSAFDPIEEIEGDDYVPHVTIARGSDADRLGDRSIKSLTWTVESLSLYSATFEEVVERISLPI
jgi:2'-5' RNA ligase